ncbi:putative porin [Aquimarina brevivitae]|uniref:Putative beta-barrel porin n=1 Tax=Aquimarina brevivitae TaxID=323412 RepID=A0A4Q7NY39_9FLAO|nr:putative porin [Aquimarina brevivitae]RZS92157.1 putative beta-barrel porin [Aquimarina brevivitae]
MKKVIVLLGFLLLGNFVFSQKKEIKRFNGQEGLRNEIQNDQRATNDSNSKEFQSLRGKKEERERPPVQEYRMINFEKDTTFVDTSLSLQKDYNFNYLRRDDFELQPINNVGQTYNSLAKREEYDHLLPLFGARARHFNFMETEDISYYYVPTPLSELYFKTTFEQGQQLDAFFTVNTSPQLNVSIAYKGVRSLGKYQNALTSTGNLRITANYNSKNDRYKLRTHFVAQDLLNEENGGLSERGVQEYLGIEPFDDQSNRDQFSDRGAISVRFEDAESMLKGKRFYMDHYYSIIKPTDSSATELRVGHELDITDKSFQFTKNTPGTDFFGPSFVSGSVLDRVALEDFTNYGYVNFNTKYLGFFEVKAGYTDYNYGYDTALTLGEPGDQINIVNRIKGDAVSLGGTYSNSIGGFDIQAQGMALVAGDFDGSYANAWLGYDLNDNYQVDLGIDYSSVAPNYNFLLYQSDYIDYNWQNYNNQDASNNFLNTETTSIKAKIKAGVFGELEASQSTINNYTYFTKNQDSVTVPAQYNNNVSLLKLKWRHSYKWFKFGLENTVMFQDVSQGDEVYRVPQLVTRNSLFYEDHWFRKALFLQTGVTFRYYSEYYADGYDPVLSEFYVLSQQEINDLEDTDATPRGYQQTLGGFPQVDLFFNAKIRQTRVFFKVENFGEAFNQNTEFSALRYAPRDAVIRFGIVWNFFL